MKQNLHTFLAVALALGISSLAAPPVQAGPDGDALGFVIDNNFSTFIEVALLDENGDVVASEVVLDIFDAVLSSNPNLDNLFTLTETQLDGVGSFVPGLPDVVAANVFTNVLDAFDDAGRGPLVGFDGFTIPQIAYNPDPFIAYNMTFTNPTDGPLDFSYNFLFPTLPVVGATEVVSQLRVDLIDADGDGSASVMTSPFDDVLQDVGFAEGEIFGAFNTDIDLGVGTDITTLGETLFDPAITAGPVADTTFDALFIGGRLILSPGDSVTVTGLAGIVETGQFLPTLANFDFNNFPSAAIPEPSSALLLLLGLATGLGRFRNRQRA